MKPAPMIVFGEDWGAHPSSTQHLMTRIAGEREILWVNSIGLRRPRLNVSDAKRLVRKVVSMLRGASTPETVQSPAGISVASAKTISWPGSKLARIFNRRMIPASLSAHVKRLGPDRPILWTSLPSAVDVVGAFDEVAVIYYAGDDFEGLAGVDHKPVGRMERELAARADLIIAASETLALKFPPHKTVVLPHGCDIERFTTPAPRATDVRWDRPVAGFYGSLADWLDYDLLEQVAVQCSDWEFAFIGKISTDPRKLARLKSLSNVRFLGPRPHSELPQYAQHWQVSLLPFVDNAQIRACNPLKLREYLAIGRPVITTAFPALAPYLDHVTTVADAAQFVSALRSAPFEDRRTCERRRASVASESWEAHADTLRHLIDALPARSSTAANRATRCAMQRPVSAPQQ